MVKNITYDTMEQGVSDENGFYPYCLEVKRTNCEQIVHVSLGIKR